ncbi:MAG: hypothetical protein M0Q92_16090 [Methanoregula sp.]|jgi:flagellar protein FlaF|nr:hypothetical protein [Methanoregula sp.]
MAVAEIIGAAVGVLLLVVVAYVLVGGTLTAAETMATAQKDITLLNEARLRTCILITVPEINDDTNSLNFNVTNNGNEIISDLPHMDVFSFNKTKKEYIRYPYDTTGSVGTWLDSIYENDYIHKNELDPGVNMTVKVAFYPDSRPDNIQIITSNGVSASSSV